VAIVIDDLEGSDPPVPSGIRIYCNADTVLRQGGYMDQSGHSCQYCIRINPKKKWSWGIKESMFVNEGSILKKLKKTRKNQISEDSALN